MPGLEGDAKKARCEDLCEFDYDKEGCIKNCESKSDVYGGRRRRRKSRRKSKRRKSTKKRRRKRRKSTKKKRRRRRR